MASKRSIFGWACYDWANSAYATTVMAGFFPVFLREYWNAGQTDTTLKLGLAHALTGLIVAVLAPVLGAIADRAGRRKLGILLFTGLGVLGVAGLAIPGYGDWRLPLVLLLVAGIGFSCANTFYDALLVDVCAPAKRDLVSALGYALGYLGGGLLFAFNLWMLMDFRRFGLNDRAQAIKLSFISVAVWWAVFSIPLFLLVRERPAPKANALGAGIVREGLAQLADTFRKIRRNRPLLLFLLAYFCYIDGVHTVIRMAVDFGGAMGLEAGAMMGALLLVQFVGFPAALVFGKLGQKYGPRVGIFIGIGVYLALTIWSCFMSTKLEFYLMAVGIGLVQGAVQALSRSFYSRLIPPDRAAEYFGFYNILGKFAAILGPLLVGLTASFISKKLHMLALLPLFVVGALLLLRVKPLPPTDPNGVK